jgi:two-component sensor histidine kinase
MLEEPHHRVKNTLAIVQSITSQSLRSSKTPLEAEEAINHRIGALGRTHEILLDHDWDTAQLRELLVGALKPFDTERSFTIEVPEIDIPSPEAVSIALAVNELSTNAVKHGALSTPAGRVSLTARIDDAVQARSSVGSRAVARQ